MYCQTQIVRPKTNISHRRYVLFHLHRRIRMDFIPGKPPEDGRRTAEDRRESERESDRRVHDERRKESLARRAVNMFDALRLTSFSSVVKMLVRLKLFEFLAMVISAM